MIGLFSVGRNIGGGGPGVGGGTELPVNCAVPVADAATTGVEFPLRPLLLDRGGSF